jgi:tricorn protease
MPPSARTAEAAMLAVLLAALVPAAGPAGYYRQPALAPDGVVFVSEGDLWTVPLAGGSARRLTTHPGDESLPAVSPDGHTLAFVGTYEGPGELYAMPLSGGRPRRLTVEAGLISWVGWADDGRLLYTTDADTGLPGRQLVALTLPPGNRPPRREMLPLAQAAECCVGDAGTVFFTRFPFQGSHTKRYRGGTAQSVWRFTPGTDREAKTLTATYAGTSKSPLWWRGRVYFLSDRDGNMNLWSMTPDGGDPRQHTRHRGWDAASPSLRGGRVAYQLGADLRLYDIAADQDQPLPITLMSDYDQDREQWVKKPAEYLTSAHLSPNGDRVALTARGRVFVAPAKAAAGRFVHASHADTARHRDARFWPDGKSLLSLSDATGEVELWRLPADGVGAPTRLTKDGKVLRWEAVPSPDGKRVAHRDKDQRLFVLDVATGANTLIEESPVDDLEGLAWSPDSAWLAYVAAGENMVRRVKLWHAGGPPFFATTDRFDSGSPAWSPDGKWLYLLSDRNLVSVVPSPWGNHQPEPFLDKKTRIYAIALSGDERSPFAPPDELHPDTPGDDKAATKKSPAVTVKADGLTERLVALPLPPGNLRDLSVNDKALFWLSTPAGETKAVLQGVAFTREKPEVKAVADGVTAYELSADGKKLLIRRDESLAVVDAAPAPADLAKGAVDLTGWRLAVRPRDEWRQMFAEAWRLERDYFYDRGMHGIDWPAVRDKYAPLVERVHSRGELSDLLAQMVSELSALHIFVRGGDTRKGPDDVKPGFLGARLVPGDGGVRVEHVHRSDPDEPERASPLARPGVRVGDGDTLLTVDGVAVASPLDVGERLRGTPGRQVRLRVRPAAGGDERDVIVTPLDATQLADLRYHEWEYTRRLEVEKAGGGRFGYVHLRAMGGKDFSDWAKGFYPAFTREGLVIDVRGNRGGNIDSWILGRLLRKAWFHWNQRVGRAPLWNMQYAFRGHVVVLCDAFTMSDGEAFCEGIKRLKLGTVIGTRTWGGEIWLRADNFLADKGIATAAEFGVFGPEGEWLIEGRGVEPDETVDNLPHATFRGEDAQLAAAVRHLERLAREKPVTTPAVPKFPDVTRPPAGAK